MTEKVDSMILKKPSRTWLQFLFSDWDRTQLVISFLLVAVVAAISLIFRSPYILGILILATLYAYMGISWNIVAGFAGQLLLAHVIFIGVGAYTTIVLYDNFNVSPWLGIPISGIVAGLVGVFIALITLRYGLKADYFALFTIALMVTLKTIFLKWKFVGAAQGMWLQLGKASWQNMIFPNKEPYIYIVMVMLVLGILVQFLIYRSKVGKYLLAIREDESAAAALGVNTSLYKTIAVVTGAIMAGIGGGFYVMYVTFVEPPQVFDLGFNVEIVMASPIIGGIGSLIGPVLGAFLNKPLAEVIRGMLSAQTSGSSLVIYGSFLILAILFMPRGIAGVLHDLYTKWHTHSTDDQPGGC